jgi:hypothetical protein
MLYITTEATCCPKGQPVDTEIVQTLALALTQNHSPEAVAEIVRWILDEVCGETAAPRYDPDARRLIEEILTPYRCEATLDAVLCAATLSDDLDRSSGYGTTLCGIEVSESRIVSK